MSLKLSPEKIVHYIIKEFYLDVPGVRFDDKQSDEIVFLNQIFELLEDFGCLNKKGIEVKQIYLSYQGDDNEN